MASALLGGILIGIATSLLLALNGRIAGISGIIGRLLVTRGDRAWRALFVAGLLVGGIVLRVAHPAAFPAEAARPIPLVALSGLLVGFGTRAANGCTSGHGVCGNSRFSLRSMVATATFIAAGMATVAIVRGLGWAG
jgi:uncharacterized membrane protein YedE/YeeE